MDHITLLALPSSLASSISLPLEILNAANELALIQRQGKRRFKLDVVSTHCGEVKTAGGLTVKATATPEMIKHTDLLILPSLWRDPLHNLERYTELIPWIHSIAAQHTRICAVGTSSYFLAEAGLLDHKPATTHWYYCDPFAERYPKVMLKRQHLITQADNLYCAGSVNSIADLMIHLIRDIYGQTIARQAETQFSPEIRRPFEDHAYAEQASSPHHDETIIEAQEWLRQNLANTVDFEQLAQHLDLSSRSLNRRFKQTLGVSPGEYLLRQRIGAARELLRTSNLSISEVAAQVGYQDSSYFCARFKKIMGQTPLAYRKSVRGKLFKLVTQ